MAFRTAVSTAMSSPALILVTMTALSYVLYSKYALYTKREAFKKAHGCQPPILYPHKDPFLGLDWIYMIVQHAKKGKMVEFFNSVFQITPTFSLRCLLRKSTLTCDPENLKTIFTTRFDDFEVESTRSVVKGLLGEGIFTMDGAFWSHSRAMLRPSFVKDQIADLDLLEKHTQALLKAIPAGGETVDLQSLFLSLSMDTSTDFLFGHSTNTLDPERANLEGKLAANIDLSLDAIMGQFKMGPFHHVFGRKSKRVGAIATREARKAVVAFVEEAIEQSKTRNMAREKKKYVFIQELVEQTHDQKRIMDECMSILIAGRDSTAALLSMLWFNLARRPDVWARLREEVDELNGELPTYEGLKNMKYLKYCANETLRVYPPISLLSKVAVRDTVLPHGGGSDGMSPLFIPKGVFVGYNMYALHRNKAVFGEDADQFRPERWADPALRPGWNYLPFGGGPRVCLGQQFALTEAYYVTVRLMQHFARVEVRGPVEFQEKFTLILSSGNGTQVGLFET